ncbi:DUF58 domain-containing protein [Marinobacteraceae bacterium S3BR75-40.1]
MQVTAGLKKRWFRWVDRRVRITDSHTMGRNNLYIFLTREGGLFAVLLVVMLLTGINYQNSLIYLLTFLLGTIFFVAIAQTHSNLMALRLTLADAGEGFAGQSLPFRVRVSQETDQLRPALALAVPDGEARSLELVPGESQDVLFEVFATRRGLIDLPRIRIETRYPFGLLKAWGWVRFASKALAYPQPLMPPELTRGATQQGEARDIPVAGLMDEMTLRPYRAGDSLARVQWKRFARSGDMVVMDWEGPQGTPQWLDYQSFPGADPELRLSYLSYLVEEFSRNDVPFGLRLPGSVVDISLGPQHRRECLRALALWRSPT